VKVTIHGTEVASTHHDEDHIRVEVKDRDGNVIQLFFDLVDDLELLAHELHVLASTIHEERREPGVCQFCDGSGMGISGPSRCLTCKGQGEVLQ